jgi:hypothetical protein
MINGRRSIVHWRLSGRGTIEVEHQKIATVAYSIIASQHGLEISTMGTLRVLTGEWRLPLEVEIHLLIERNRVATVVIQSGSPKSGDYSFRVNHVGPYSPSRSRKTT